MEKIIVSIKNSNPKISYPIIIGRNILHRIKTFISSCSYTQVGVITDSHVAPLWLNKLRKALGVRVVSVVVGAGEKHKSIESVQKAWQILLHRKFDRQSLLVNLGGGMIGDLGGFVAATYMRGIDFIQVPTTVLAQVDASIGGKVGFNFGRIKNSIGAFAQPQAVWIDLTTLTTLPDREFREGFGEIIKHGLIASRVYFQKVTHKEPKAFSEKELLEVIKESVKIKQSFVVGDEKEKGQRKILNFGHTVGHALEAISLQTARPLLHGEAISIGMVAEAKISALVKRLDPAEVVKIEEALRRANLPIRFTLPGSAERMIRIMQKDKKSEKGRIKFVLLEKIGRAIFDQEVSNQVIVKALGYILKK